MKNRIALFLWAGAVLICAGVIYAQIASGSITNVFWGSTLVIPNSTSAYGGVFEPTFKDETGNQATNKHTELAALSVFLTPTTIHASDEVGVVVKSFTAVGTTTTNASGIKITAPTGAANNYGIWSTGTVRLDDSVALGLTPQADIVDVKGTMRLIPVSRTDLANLAATTNGVVVYCYSCTADATCSGPGTGAIAKRLNSAWVCN